MSVEKTEIETFFGRCRCCLSYGYLKNMWTEHLFEGEAEIYGEMLVQCFGLTWEHTEDSMEQDQICEQCICRLRDASDFKKVVLDSQEELLQQIDAGIIARGRLIRVVSDAKNSTTPISSRGCRKRRLRDSLEDGQQRSLKNIASIKEERLEEDFLIEYKGEEDTADTIYADTEYTADAGDTITSAKDETEYEEIEYLEDEDVVGASDTDSSQPTDQLRPVKRQKQPRQPDTDDDEGPKRKWPRRLPKSERHKTYKQYSEVDLRKCVEEVRNNELTTSEAALKYNIPKKTIRGKIKEEPKDVRTDIQKSTNNATTRKRVTRSQTKVPTLSNEEQKHTETDTESDAADTTNGKKTRENKYQMLKHKNNLKQILKYSNATVIKGHSSVGYSCCFCDKYFSPENLKKHYIEHGHLYDDIIKVKYVAHLIIKLDITGLKCKLCEEEIDSLEELMEHLRDEHSKIIYTDIDNHFIPFKFDSDKLQCAICTQQFNNFKLLSEHMCEHYSNFKCSECNRVFINKQSMQTHSYRHIKREYKCSQCPKIFDSQMKIREHEHVTHKLSNKKRKCGYCNEKFSSADLVRNHESKKHGVVRSKFDCGSCDKTFVSQKALNTHTKRHHLLMRPFECETCGRGFYTRQELKWHTVTHTKTKEFHCDECDNSFGTKPALNQHLRAHRGHHVQIDNTTESNNKMNLRKRPTASESEATKVTETKRDRKPLKEREVLLNHEAQIQNITKPSKLDDQRFMYKHKANLKAILQNSNATLIRSYGRDGYLCNFCDIQAETPNELKQHNLKVHPNEADGAIKTKYVADLIIKLDITDFKCKLCKETINTLEEFMEHLSQTHSKFIYTDVKNYIIPFKFDSDTFRCFMCDKNYEHFKLLSEHMTEHYRNFDCSDCDRSFINKQAMQTHSYRHITGIFNCFHCPKVFDTRPKRNEHERVKHVLMGKQRKCANCDERFSTWDHLLDHEVKAHGVTRTKYACQDCDKTYGCQSSLVLHRNRFHLMKKPYKCSHCEKAFCTKPELNYHTINHTKTNNYTCGVCKKLFETLATLNQHMQTHVGVKKYLCDYCNRWFLNRSNFERHMMSIHGEIV